MRAVLAVANLMHSGGDADAFALQVLQKQQEIIESFKDDRGFQAKKAYKLVAFGSYIRAILNEADPLKLGVARASYEKVKSLEPNFAFADDDLKRATSGKHSEKGNGVVHVIAFVGKGPSRVEAQEHVSRNILAIAQVVWALYRDRWTIPNITSVKIPALSFWPGNPTEMHVSADGQPVATTATITDVEAVARKEFEAMRDTIVLRAVLRRAFKIFTTEALKEALNPRDRRDRHRRSTEKDLIDLGISGAGLLWTALEKADLRCWGLLPASFQVARVELPAGEHEIQLRAGLRGRPVSAEGRIRVLVRDGFNTYVVVQAPTLDGAPTTMTSESVDVAVSSR